MIVPQVQLVGRHLLPPVRFTWSCHVCGHPAAAMSESQVSAAMDAHAAHVNATRDCTTDPHFADGRMDQLLADGR